MTPPDHFADSREAVLKARALLRQAHAVIFDFDGLLVDTEYAIYSSWERVFASCGHPLPLDLFNQCLGSGYTHWNPGEHLEKLTGRTFDWETVNSRRQEEIVRDLEHAGLLPGAGELIRNLGEAGTPMGVASRSSHRWVDGWLNRLGIMPYFQTVVCRDDGLPVKPDPALFLKAAENLGKSPSECLVLEDSQNGTTAAHRAGMPVISVPNRVTEQADFSLATSIIRSLTELL